MREIAAEDRRPTSDASLPYVGLESIESNTGRIAARAEPPGSGLAFRFDERHILYGKLRPYLNKVALPSFAGRCSTEAIPLLTSSDTDRRFVAWFLRSPAVVSEITRATTGSRMPRADMQMLGDLQLDVPPLPEQRRIADAIDAAMTEATAATTAAALQAVAFAAWTHVAREALLRESVEQADEVALGDTCDLDGPLVDPRLPQYACLPCVSAEHIEPATGELFDVSTAAEQDMISGKYQFMPGAVLYSKLRPYLRKAAIAPFGGLCSADMYPLRAKPNVEPEYLVAILLSDDFSHYAESLSRRARMPKLNREQLFSYPASLPPLALQKAFVTQSAELSATTTELQSEVDARDRAIASLPAAILAAAFQGQL